MSEVAILKSLNHENIIQLLDYQIQNDQHALVFPLYDGDLFQRLESGGPFTESVAQTITLQLTLAVDHLHTHGIIHRDIKLENVLVQGMSLNMNTKVLLADFGFAKKINDSFTTTPCGTFQYVHLYVNHFYYT